MRIAIVNDLMMAVEALKRVVASVEGYEIAWVALDGAEAVAKCAQDRPDLVLMDLVMPVMDGVEATRRIMAQSPCAVLVVTASLGSNQAKVFEAMGQGALDAAVTPALGLDGQTRGGEALLAKIATIAKLLGKTPGSARSPWSRPGPAGERPPLVALGSSTGGPMALVKILSRLPADFPGAVVIVQHVDAMFTPGLAEWLDSQTPLKVALAEEGSWPRPGQALLASSNHHLRLNQELRLTYDPEPRNNAYRPSVDVFFSSLAQHWPGRDLAVLLTGMGRDGAQGLLALRQAGWHTIAQDQASSVVYGMPKAAQELGAAVEVLPLDLIGPRLSDLAARRPRVARREA